MTPAVLVLLAATPCVYWTQGVETRPAVEAARITRICVPSDQAEPWRQAGLTVTAVSEADLAARESLPAPGVTARAGVASPTRAPWVVANGWRFVRKPAAKFVYAVPAGKGALAAAEAFAYNADVVLQIDPADLAGVGSMQTFLDALPPSDLPLVADVAVVDDGTAVTGEVMNLLARRNLLFEVVQAASPRARLNVAIGTKAYPIADAADPSAFAQRIRRELTDERRSLRIFGSEVVIGRLTGDGRHLRLHLINYGGRDIEGLRIRVRGNYPTGDAWIEGAGRLALEDHEVRDGATEFSLPRLLTYAVVDLR